MLRWTQQELRGLLDRKIHIDIFSEIMEARGTMVVPPGMITTMECRVDQSRFFPRLDDNDRVINGNFG